METVGKSRGKIGGLGEKLTGDGEMSERIRRFDWAKTSLGAIETWQQSLVTAVNLVLNSRFSMFVWWGKDLTYIYNDAYLPTLGSRHPAALGQSAREVWAEAWDILGPQAEAVIEKGESSWNEELLLFLERHGFPEETYHTFSYSPITDDFGKVGGLFCAVSEDTQKVLSRRRLQTLRDLGERALEKVQTVEEACRVAAETLGENPFDIPLAQIYLLEPDEKTARLCQTVNLASQAVIEIGTAGDIWCFGDILTVGRGQKLPDIEKKFGRIAAGVWTDDFVREAFVLPLAKTGGQNVPAGFLVCGLSPRLEFNKEYQDFIELAAGQIATAIANARALEEERKRAEALAEIDRAKTEFFSNVSHEFRTPLTLMLGNLEDALVKGKGITPTVKTQLETAHRNSLRLLKLVNNLLDFSRIEAGRQQAAFAPVDLSEFTSDLASNFRSALENEGLQFLIDCPPLSAPVYVDREMWEKIVLNLISNAFKFTFHGAIEIALIERRETVELKVKDTGVGIPADQLTEIFKRFHRVRQTQGRTFEGTGIGLSLVQELVRQHGGEITVESELGRRTTFTVTIPKGKSHLSPAQITETSQQISPSKIRAEVFLNEVAETSGLVSSPGKLKDKKELAEKAAGRILLADDNQDMRDYVRRMLENEGYVVTAVGDGQAALDVLQTAANGDVPDLVLSDVMMPRLNGFELLEAIRREQKTREIPFILLSARAGEESKVEGLEAGADDYLIKPFSARELLARVESNLKLVRIRREANENLRESEVRFRNMADYAPVMIWITEPDATCTYLSQSWYDFTGQTPDTGLGFGWLGAVHPDDTEAIEKIFVAANERREAFRLEYRLRRKDGEYRWAIDSARPRFSENAEFLGYIGSVLDITERKMAEDALRESEERFRLFVTAVSDIVYRMSADWREMLFLEGKSLLADTKSASRTWLEKYIPDSEKALVQAAITKAISTKQLFELEHRVIRADGTIGWTFSRAVPVLDAAGEIVEWFGTARDITERKEAEEALAKSEENYRTLFESMQEGYAVAETIRDENGKMINYRFLQVNPVFEKLTGLNRNLTVGKTAREVLSGLDEKWFEIYQKVVDTRETIRVEDYISPLNRWYAITAFYYGEEQFAVLFNEISERKRREMNTAFLAEIGDVFARISDPEKIMQTVGEKIGAYLHLSSCAFNEIDLERRETRVPYGWFRADVPNLIGGLYRHADYVTDEFHQAAKRGQTIIVNDTQNDSRIADKKNYQAIKLKSFISVPFHRDGEWKFLLAVTDSKPRAWRTDEIELIQNLGSLIFPRLERALAEKDLRESRAHLKLTTEAAGIGTWQWSAKTNQINWNDIQQKMWGYEPGGAIGHYQEGMRLVVEEDKSLIETAIEKCLQGAEDYDVEYRIIPLGSNEIRWIRSVGKAAFNKQKECLSIQGISLDVTENKRAEAERERLLKNEQSMRLAAEQANRLKDEFLATVSHELRTPLNAILGWSNIARRSDSNEETKNRALEVIERSSRNQSQIISDILEVSRIITGKLKLNLQPLVLSQVIQAAIDTLQPAMEARTIRLQVNLENDDFKIKGDADRLQQVVWNLLSNAVKFTPEGGAIEISLHRQNNFAEIIVRDNGEGIEPEFLPFVFDRFRQADGRINRKHGGLGLGLAIVRHLTELHGGRVAVESKGKNQGATFIVRLPLNLPATKSDRQTPEISTGNPAEIDGLREFYPRKLAGLKILVVDDDSSSLELVSFILTENGAQVFAAESVTEALAIFEREKLDVLVSDIGIPERDGYELIWEIIARTKEQKRIIQTVALTAYARAEDERQALQAGYQAFLPKPLEPIKLVDVITELTQTANYSF